MNIGKMNMNYKKIFDPSSIPIASLPGSSGDNQGGAAYVYSDHIVLAVNVALATGRPLLVRGASGCGKSALALSVARHLKWRYYERVISSRTQARDLLWEVDQLRRLQDAQAKALKEDIRPYINPGILWWGFDSKSACRRGVGDDINLEWPMLTDPSGEGALERAVILIDEIDKADPDVPNNLLVPLGSLRFSVDDAGIEVKANQSPLIFLTTNDERELPVAFLRRCVELKLELPSKEMLVAIGKAHFGKSLALTLEKVADLITQTSRNTPSTAEYLDTVRACLELDIKPDTEEWKQLSNVTVWKHGRKSGM